MKYDLYEQRLKSLFKSCCFAMKIDQATEPVKNLFWKFVIGAKLLLLELMLVTVEGFSEACTCGL